MFLLVSQPQTAKTTQLLSLVGSRIGREGQHSIDLSFLHVPCSDRILESPSMAGTSMLAMLINSKQRPNIVGIPPQNSPNCILRSIRRAQTLPHALHNLRKTEFMSLFTSTFTKILWRDFRFVMLELQHQAQSIQHQAKQFHQSSENVQTLCILSSV